MSKVIAMPNRNSEPPAPPPPNGPIDPWSALGFSSERDMLIDDLKTLDQRIKSASTTATAIAALSKRKQEVLEQIKALDDEDGEDDILDDAEDESWTVGS